MDSQEGRTRRYAASAAGNYEVAHELDGLTKHLTRLAAASRLNVGHKQASRFLANRKDARA
jgi:hypothetical protein